MKRVFILGAGASADVIPTGNKFFDKAKELVKEGKGASGLKQDLNIFRSYLPSNDKKGLPFASLEDIFTLHDIACKKREQFFSIGALEEQQGIIGGFLLDFIKEVIISSFSDPTTDIYLEFADKITKEDTLVCFNYDTLLDNALLFSKKGLNYGLEFKIIKPFYFLEKGFEEPIRVSNNQEFPLLIKPHGSLNWYYCPECYQFYFSPNPNLTKSSDNSCNREYCEGLLNQYIIPLTLFKNYEHPLLHNSWLNVVKNISEAKEIYFIGYSLPPTDFMCKYYIWKGIKANKKGIKKFLVNPNEDIKENFESLFGKIDDRFTKNLGYFNKFVKEF